MSPRKNRSLSSVQWLALLVILVAAGAVVAVVFAPSKPAAPPVSRMTVSDRPAPTDMELAAKALPADLPPVAPLPKAAPAPAPETHVETEPAAVVPGVYQVLGAITEKDSGEPLSGVQVFAVLEADEATVAECEKRVAEATAADDARALRAAERDCAALTADRESVPGNTGADGMFKIAIATPGRYRLVVPGKNELPSQRRQVAKYEAALGVLNDDSPEARHDVTLDLKAAISGRVVEAGSRIGAQEVKVSLMDAAARNEVLSATTDADGAYELPVDLTGEFAVKVELAGSPYLMGDLVPFRRVKVPEPDAVVEGVDFEVDPAGIVWGYVTTPKGDPVASSEVILCTAESPLTQFVTAALKRAPPLSDRSKDDGYYELLGVPLNQEWQLLASSDAKAPQLAQPFVLTSSTRSLRVDVFLFPGSRITGVVVDSGGQPVPEARLRCIPSLTSLVRPMDTAYAFRDVRADAQGMFVLEEVPAGSYNLYAQKQGFKFDTAGVSVYPDGYSELTGVKVMLYPIEAGEHDVFGKVVDGEGNGISGVSVELNGLALDSMTRISESASTGADGEFRFRNLPAGRYGGIFSKEGFGIVRKSSLALDRENIVSMVEATLVRGRVLIRESNQPPLQYFVQATKTGSLTAGTESVAAGQSPSGQFSNPDGSFELYLTPGDYLLTATSDGLTPGRTPALVEQGAVMDDIVIYVSETGGAIRGTVKTMDGRSPQGTVVRLVDTSGGLGEVLEGGSPINTEYTVGEDGVFSFEQLPAGTYIINATNPNYATASTDPITLAEGEQRDGVELRLGSGGVLIGTVCTSDGQPWAGASIFVGSPDSGTIRDATTDNSGMFQMDGLATGEYTVTATSLTSGDLLGGDRLVRSVRVEDGQTAEVDFCSEGIRITGLVSPPPPGVLGGGQVFLLPPGSPTSEERFAGREAEFLQLLVQGGNSVDSQGFYEIPGMAPGVYQIEVVYFSLVPGGDGGFNSVHVGLVELTGDQPVMQYDIQASAG